MLTNNKKSIFAKSIAMIMAVLMVLAVCLTGCADKEAQAAADAAQTTATEAKTAADAVKKALEDHLASLDPVTLEKVNQEIDKALADYAKTEALADFVKSGDLKALSDKLADYVKAAELKTEVEKIVGAYVKPADLTKVENDLNALITAAGNKADAVKTEITETLKGYVKNSELGALATDEELAAKATELTNSLTAKIDAIDTKVNNLGIDDKITSALMDYATKAYVDAAVEAGKYDDSALAARVAKLEEVVKGILNAFYTEKEIEERAENFDLLGMSAAEVTEHINNTWSINGWNAATVKVLALIEDVQDLLTTIYDPIEGVYTEEHMEDINAELAKVNLDPIFVDGERTDKEAYTKMLTYTLLRLPNVKTLEAYQNAFAEANKVPNFKKEYEDLLSGMLLNIGHIETVGDPAKQYQVVTVVDQAAIEAFNAAYDALLTKYVVENAFAGNTKYGSTFGTLTAINIFDLGTKKVADVGATYINGKDAAGKDIVLQPVGKTIRPAGDYVATAKLASTAALNYAAVTPAKVVMGEKYGKQAIDVVEYTSDASKADVAGTYAALYAQLAVCQKLIDDANTIFANFCKDTIKANTVATLPELGAEGYFNAYLNALESYMCIEVDGYGPYALYLKDQVQTAMEAAIARNTCDNAEHTAEALEEITYLDLYYAMLDKVYNVLFDLYKSYAATMLDNMKFDYMSVSWHLISNGFAAPAVTGTTAISTTSDYMTNEVAQGIKNGTLSEGFIDAFLNGTNTVFTGWASGNALKIEKSFVDTALLNYYALNGTAMYADGTAVNADPVATIIAYSAEDHETNVRQYLNAATVMISYKISALTVEDAKKVDSVNAEKVFEDLLKQAVANLDEVYNRYLVEDYKKVLINTIYDEADVLANLYSGVGDTALIEAIEQYLTGYSKTTGSAHVDADGKAITTNKLFPEVTELVNGSLAAKMAESTFVVDVEDKTAMDIKYNEETYEINMIGGAAMDAAEIAAKEFLASMEEMAIKDNFIVYLDTALNNLTNLYYNYFAISGLDYKMQTELHAKKNNYDQTISMNKFMEEAGNIIFGTYRESYASLLAIVATKEQDNHITQLRTWTITKIVDGEEKEVKLADLVNVHEEALKKVLSSNTADATPKKFVDSGLNKVNKPVDWMDINKEVSYKYVGNAAVDFDRIVNVNAEYVVETTKTENGVTITITTYHKLYN